MTLGRRGFFAALCGGAVVPELEAVKSAEILRLEKGDVIVLKSREPLNDEMAARIKQAMKRIVPRNEVVVLDESIEISVIKG